MTRPRPRSLLTILIALGALGWSCLPPSIESMVSGSIRIDPTHQSWTKDVRFTANGVARDGGGRIIIGLSFQARWSDGDHPGPDVDGSMTRLGVWGADADAEFDSRGCTGKDCVGRYRVTFSWLPELKTGHVDVSWAVTGSVNFEDVPVDEDAEVSVSVA